MIKKLARWIIRDELYRKHYMMLFWQDCLSIEREQDTMHTDEMWERWLSENQEARYNGEDWKKWKPMISHIKADCSRTCDYHWGHTGRCKK